jgi:hypothetical protein
MQWYRGFLHLPRSATVRTFFIEYVVVLRVSAALTQRRSSPKLRVHTRCSPMRRSARCTTGRGRRWVGCPGGARRGRARLSGRLCVEQQGLKRMDQRAQQGGMDPFGSVFEAFGFPGDTRCDTCPESETSR